MSDEPSLSLVAELQQQIEQNQEAADDSLQAYAREKIRADEAEATVKRQNEERTTLQRIIDDLDGKVKRLTELNAGLVRDHNGLLIDGARWQTRAEAAEATVERLRERLDGWDHSKGRIEEALNGCKDAEDADREMAESGNASWPTWVVLSIEALRRTVERLTREWDMLSEDLKRCEDTERELSCSRGHHGRFVFEYQGKLECYGCKLEAAERERDAAKQELSRVAEHAADNLTLAVKHAKELSAAESSLHALRSGGYVRHKPECIVNMRISGGLKSQLGIPTCTCGLEALLRVPEGRPKL